MLGLDTITVYVTRKHINGGEKCSAKLCPISLAIQEKIPDMAYCGVGNTRALCVDKTGSRLYSYVLPHRCTQFINKYDGQQAGEGLKFDPFEFTMYLNKNSNE